MSTLTQFMGGSGGSGIFQQIVYTESCVWRSPIKGKILFTLIGGGGSGGYTYTTATGRKLAASGGGAGNLTKLILDVDKDEIFYFEVGLGGLAKGPELDELLQNEISNTINGSSGGHTRMWSGTAPPDPLDHTWLARAFGGFHGIANASNGTAIAIPATQRGPENDRDYYILSIPGGVSGTAQTGVNNSAVSTGGGSVGVFTSGDSTGSKGRSSESVDGVSDLVAPWVHWSKPGAWPFELRFGTGTYTNVLELIKNGHIIIHNDNIFSMVFGVGGVSGMVDTDPLSHGSLFCGGSGGSFSRSTGSPVGEVGKMKWCLPAGQGGRLGGGGGGMARNRLWNDYIWSPSINYQLPHGIRSSSGAGGVGGIIVEYFIKL